MRPWSNANHLFTPLLLRYYLTTLLRDCVTTWTSVTATMVEWRWPEPRMADVPK